MATRGTVGRRGFQDKESYGSYWRGLGVVVALWAAVVPASARSTLSVRLDQPAIAGPALDQQSILYLHYFPGDGEAIVSAELQCLGNARLQNVRSALGQAQLEAASVGIDYAARPLAGEHIDTLYIALVAAEVEKNRLVRGDLLLARPTGHASPPNRIRPSGAPATGCFVVH